jgi:hypothetical protein
VFGVWVWSLGLGLGFSVWGLGLGVRVQTFSIRFKAYSLGGRIQDLGVVVYDLACRIGV